MSPQLAASMPPRRTTPLGASRSSIGPSGRLVGGTSPIEAAYQSCPSGVMSSCGQSVSLARAKATASARRCGSKPASIASTRCQSPRGGK